MRNPLKRKASRGSAALEEAAGASPVIRYVNIMLYQMHKTGSRSRVLRAGKPLDSITVDGYTLDAPPLPAVLNRLKVMSGLNPMNYATEPHGKIRLIIGGDELLVQTTFSDDGEERCRVEFQKTDAEQNKASQGMAPPRRP